MTPQGLRNASLRLQKFSVTNREPLRLQKFSVTTKQEEGKLRSKFTRETAIMDLSFPGQRTDTATPCMPHHTVYMVGPRAGKSENGFFRYLTPNIPK